MKSGFVSITGRPNVGKSTFLNSILGQKVSIVTPKPQTTRNKIIGIKTLREAQIVFLDTPGIHRPVHKLGSIMVKEAKQAVRDVDIVLFMVEPKSPTRGDISVIRLFAHLKKPVILLINKIDALHKLKLLPVIEQYRGLYPFEDIIPVSSLKGDGIDTVIEEVLKRLPEGPKYYPDDLVTDRLERFMATEFIREKVMQETEEEVPHAVAVEIMEWTEKPSIVHIGANILVEKAGQKGIIIGKRGEKLKSIGTLARKDIERLLDVKVFLELWVKVKPGWRENKAALTELGLKES